ncbi:MAG: nitroreductase family protein [Defluviitaleaceae bacterium]|nr:nitroreductase family protein [Defluviitaleaceae bacterium]
MDGFQTLDVILGRRSCRGFSTEPVPQEILVDILEAGQAAPYIMPNSRHFTVLRDRRLIEEISRVAKGEGGKISAEHFALFSSPGFDGTYGASTLIILSGNEATRQFELVCGLSAQNMLITAQAFGVASCIAYFPIFAFFGADGESWRNRLKIPAGFRPSLAVMLGYSEYGMDDGADGRYKNEITYIS